MAKTLGGKGISSAGEVVDEVDIEPGVTDSWRVYDYETCSVHRAAYRNPFETVLFYLSNSNNAAVLGGPIEKCKATKRVEKYGFPYILMIYNRRDVIKQACQKYVRFIHRFSFDLQKNQLHFPCPFRFFFPDVILSCPKIRKWRDFV